MKRLLLTRPFQTAFAATAAVGQVAIAWVLVHDERPVAGSAALVTAAFLVAVAWYASVGNQSRE